MINLRKVICLCFAMLVCAVMRAEVKLPAVFGDNMVLQRDQPLKIWGWASAGEAVTVQLNGQRLSTKADKNGDWWVKLDPLSAGGPYELRVSGQNELVIKNVLIGDVWICSGQSNMEWEVSKTNFSESDTAFINTAPIRLMKAWVETDYMPRSDITTDGWHQLSKEQIDRFSAVAYHFGKQVSLNTDVPIGLISDNLGATAVEAWMSNEALMEFPQYKEELAPIVKAGKNVETLNKEFEEIKDQWFKEYYFKGPGVEGEWFKPDTDVSDWETIEASGNTWENEERLKSYDGAVWFRTTFDLPEGFDDEQFMLNLLQIDDYDMTWVNGQKIGETYGKHNHRTYFVPKSLLKPKGNVLVVRVFDAGGIGGFTTSPFWGNTVLWGKWQYKKGLSINPDKFKKPNVPSVTPFSSPASLYNANIAPLTDFGIKGAIWYQGESNVDRAYEYRALFSALIKDWRRQWGQGDFPFIFVQLANHLAEVDSPQASNWAELREAQAMALQLPNTGMATAIDIGEADDIHPKNKEDVGKRLALNALKLAYGQNVVASGPMFASMSVEENKAIINYKSVGDGLVTKDKYGYVRGFQIAGEDKKFYWAKAKIVGNTVEVYAEEVKNPIAVRYAWSSNPGALDLYNSEGLPAVPFRTDNWPGITKDKVFLPGPRF
ncbi:sialate O-acetylesterase [Roseivirga pacifica]|uniref:sialate O-acetylesterase n=1 Tax=Roseivirga pacifica TaxID=1267423 RepID=UPI003BAEB61D